MGGGWDWVVVGQTCGMPSSAVPAELVVSPMWGSHSWCVVDAEAELESWTQAWQAMNYLGQKMSRPVQVISQGESVGFDLP